MPNNNLVFFIVNRREEVLLVKHIGKENKESLWKLPGGRISLKYGFMHAAKKYLRPYFRDLTIRKVTYIRSPIENMVVGNERRRVIPINCYINGTIKRQKRGLIWFTKVENILNHVVVSGTLEVLSLPEIKSRLV